MKKGLKKVTAIALASAISPTVMAATSDYHTTRRDSNGQYYVDDFNNKVYDDFIIDCDGNKIYSDYYFDYRDNAVMNYSRQYNNHDNYPNYPNYNNYNNYSNYNNYDMSYEDYCNFLREHLNVEISNSSTLALYLEAHSKNCTDPRCREGYNRFFANNNYNFQYNNGYNPNMVENPNNNVYGMPYISGGQMIAPGISNNYQQEYSTYTPVNNGQFYTMVKNQNGVTKYAYSADTDVTKYGIYGWALNSVYNENDYDLNSVFYEEIYTFGNDFRYNPYIVNAINNNVNMYVYKYYTADQELKYCVSTTQDLSYINMNSLYGSNNYYEYNSKFNINDALVPLKTLSAVQLENTNAYNYAPVLRYTR